MTVLVILSLSVPGLCRVLPAVVHTIGVFWIAPPQYLTLLALYCGGHELFVDPPAVDLTEFRSDIVILYRLLGQSRSFVQLAVHRLAWTPLRQSQG